MPQHKTNLSSPIAGVTQGPPDLTAPLDTPDGQVWRYGVGFLLQLAPRRAAVLAAIEVACTPTYGFLNGSDLVPFDDPSGVLAAQTTAVNRNERWDDSPTQKAGLILKSPMLAGFVPLGARRSDGSNHPAAGTGFGLCQAHAFPLDEDGRFQWWSPGRRDLLEVHAFSYDGAAFRSVRTQTATQNPESPLMTADNQWRIVSSGMTTAIPDGDDLLLPVLAGKADGSAVGVGACRWTFRDGRWQPAAFLPTAEAKNPGQGANLAEKCPWFEPSLARMADGSLLFGARGQPGEGNPDSARSIEVWRSSDNGRSWRTAARAADVRNDAPVSVGCTADGTPYVISNPYDPNVAISPKTGRGRGKLVCWPIDLERGGLASPFTIRDAQADFGPLPPSDDPDYAEAWLVDHPTTAALRLADGRWHNVMACRVTHGPLYRPSKAFPSAWNGCHLEELISKGPAVPAWNFSE